VKKTLNYTGRKEIPQEFIHIRVDAIKKLVEMQPLELPENLRREHKKLEECQIYLEAYMQSHFHREHGGSLKEPESLNFYISTFPDDLYLLKFRVKVTDERTGRLLRLENRLIPKEIIEKDVIRNRSFLPVQPVSMDGVWNLRYFDATEPPVLEINRKLGNYLAFVQSPTFAHLVVPQILLQVFLLIINELQSDDIDLEDTWANDWLNLISPYDWRTNFPMLKEKNYAEVKSEIVSNIIEEFIPYLSSLSTISDYQDFIVVESKTSPPSKEG
jgi:hypothetical protein